MVDHLANIDRREATWRAYTDVWQAWCAAMDTGDTPRALTLAAELARWLDEVGVRRAEELRREFVRAPHPVAGETQP